MGQQNSDQAQDDQAWFDGLSGRAGSPQATRLHNMLREIELDDAAREDTTHDRQRLQFALRREQARPVARPQSRLKYFAMAASVLIVVGAASMLLPKDEMPASSPVGEEAGMRGSSEQVILSAAPEKEARQLEAELVALGVQVKRISSAEKTELQIALSYPVKGDVRAVLERRTIPLPERGDLLVSFIRS